MVASFPLGYKVAGKQQTARLVPDDTIIWDDRTAADLVRKIYHWLGVDGQSCRWIAGEFNLLGVPTVHVREGRDVRVSAPRALGGRGRIRNLVVNTVYKGTYQYGRRRPKDSKRTETIDAMVPPLVTAELWESAQRTLAKNRLFTKSAPAIHLLRATMVCGVCGLHYGGVPDVRGSLGTTATGSLSERGKIAGRCPGKAIRSDLLEPKVWGDMEAWLRNPGDLLDELKVNQEQANQRRALEDQVRSLETALAALTERRKRAVDLHIRGRIDEAELDDLLAEVDKERKTLQDRLGRIVIPEEDEAPVFRPDLLAELRDRLAAGLDEAQRQQIVQLLVRRILVETTGWETGEKDGNASD